MTKSPLPSSELPYFYQLELMQQKILSQAKIPVTELNECKEITLEEYKILRNFL